MQKPGVNVRPRIPPSCVFQLQCIVDSLMVSRGWSTSGFHDHITMTPASSFRPRRDVDLFLDRQNEREPQGFCRAVDLLVQVLEKDAMLHGDFSRHEAMSIVLKGIQEEFVNWLGESGYMHGLTTIPPSRFSDSNSNGLWEYSPFLCGVGLMEALEIAYGLGLRLWDEIPEPVCIIHLHNMLVAKGYINRPIGLYSTLQDLFPNAFFENGKPPTSNFLTAMVAATCHSLSHRAKAERRALRKTTLRTGYDVHRMLDPGTNKLFKQKSILKLYRDADWYHERISDEQLPEASTLAILRIAQTKQVTDPLTDKKIFERTFLVKRALAQGLDDEKMREFMSIISEKDNVIPEELLPAMPEGYSKQPPMTFGRSALGTQVLTSEAELMRILQMDIVNDVDSVVRPISSLSYFFVAAQFLLLFMRIEDKLKELRNPLWVRAYEEDSKMMREKRLSLTTLALEGDDEECLRVMAEVFESPGMGFINYVYWEGLYDRKEMQCDDPLDDYPAVGSYTLM